MPGRAYTGVESMRGEKVIPGDVHRRCHIEAGGGELSSSTIRTIRTIRSNRAIRPSGPRSVGVTSCAFEPWTSICARSARSTSRSGRFLGLNGKCLSEENGEGDEDLEAAVQMLTYTERVIMRIAMASLTNSV
jgi:hypothetical protein